MVFTVVYHYFKNFGIGLQLLIYLEVAINQMPHKLRYVLRLLGDVWTNLAIKLPPPFPTLKLRLTLQRIANAAAGCTVAALDHLLRLTRDLAAFFFKFCARYC